MSDETRDAGLRAGVARTDITPPVGIAHGNWGAATHSRADGIDLPLWATVLALHDAASDTRVVIVEADLLHASFALAGQIRAAVAAITGVPAAHVRLSVSHTHSGPTLGTTWLEEGAELIEPYVAALPGRIAGAAWQAMRSLRPARVTHGSGTCHIGVNRRFRTPDGRMTVGRDPDGFFDPTVRVLRVDGADGAPLAAVLHYACHPTIMAYENRLITPDYPGPARRAVEQLTGAPCLFIQGCAGNIGPRVGFTEGQTGHTTLYHRAGKTLGAEAARVYLSLDSEAYDATFSGVVESGAPLAIYRHTPRSSGDTTLRVATATATLPVRPFPTRADGEARARDARETLAQKRRAGAPEAEIVEATYRAKRIAQQAGHSRLTDGKPEVQVELQAIRIGSAAILGAPMEVFNELGAAVAERSPFAWTAVCGYTNGSAGYLPTAKAFDGGGYEVEMASQFARGAGEVFVEAASSLLRELA